MEKTKTPKAKTSFLLIFLALAASSLLLSGCGGSMGGFFKGNSQNIETYNFRQGTEGIRMDFIEGMPPSQLFIGTDFSTGIKLKNMGAYDVAGDAQIKISVPDESAFQFKGDNPQTFTMRGKSLYIKEGEEDVKIFPMKALCFPGYSEQIVRNYTRKLKATACYYYETTANADICIDPRKYLRAEKEKAECQMADKTLSGGQGGPVGVARITPTVIPQSQNNVEVQLSIAIDKLQGADHNLYHPSSGCTDPQQLNRIQIEVEMGGEGIPCTPSEILLKERNTVSTICKKTLDTSFGAFLTPVTVNMRYYVQQTKLKDITVEPPPMGYGQTINCATLGGSAPAQPAFTG
ncbi:hypothetical protein KY359_03520 [Candidatus Woesearchaeota archaeon]|nr:hypothetical protein [Candidatus Woesearchaeota archaeon]